MYPFLIALGLLLLLSTAARGSVRSLSYSDKITEFADGIAKAEGYGIPGAIPTVRNNPGDLKLTAGVITTFDTPDDGWNALYRQLDLMFSGRSQVYDLDWTISEVAYHWTGNDNPEGWAATVARHVGISPYNTLRDYVEG